MVSFTMASFLDTSQRPARGVPELHMGVLSVASDLWQICEQVRRLDGTSLSTQLLMMISTAGNEVLSCLCQLLKCSRWVLACRNCSSSSKSAGSPRF